MFLVYKTFQEQQMFLLSMRITIRIIRPEEQNAGIAQRRNIILREG